MEWHRRRFSAARLDSDYAVSYWLYRRLSLTARTCATLTESNSDAAPLLMSLFHSNQALPSLVSGWLKGSSAVRTTSVRYKSPGLIDITCLSFPLSTAATMAPPFLVDSAQIVGLFMESILYGVYLVTLAQCLRALLLSPADHHFKKNIQWPMLSAAILMFTFATLDVTFGLRHNLDAFVYYTGPGGAREAFEDISYWVTVMKVADYVGQTCIGDAILIYRCFMIWGKKWWIIVPSMFLWLGGTTCGVILIHTLATLHGAALTNTSSATPWVDSMTALTLAMNILTTSLIVYRIWSVDRQTSALIATLATTSKRRVSRLKTIMRILIDSAALYTVSVIVFVATYVAGSNAEYGTSDNVVQIIGISFNLIIIRVNSDSASAREHTIPDSNANGRLKWRAPASAAAGRPVSVSMFQSPTVTCDISRGDVPENCPSKSSLDREEERHNDYP